MDPYGSPYRIPNNSPHNHPFPHSLLSTKVLKGAFGPEAQRFEAKRKHRRLAEVRSRFC